MGIYKKTLKRIAHLQTHNPFATIFVLLALTVFAIGGIPYVKTVASLEKMMPEKMEEIKYFNVLRDNFLGKDMIGIVIDVDMESQNEKGIFSVKDKRVLEYIENLKEQISQEDDVIETFAVTDVLRKINNNRLPDEQEFDSLLKNKETANLLRNYINDDFSTTYIIVNTDVGRDDRRLNNLAEAIKKDIEDAGRPPGISIRLAGVPLIQQELSKMIKSSMLNSLWFSVLLVFLITFLLYRSLVSSLLPLAIVFISVVWLYGTMGYFSLGISTLAGGVAAIVIGVGIDYAIHLMNRYKYERRQGKKIEEAIEESVASTGTALFATAATTLAAFFAFLFGTMPEMGRFGTLMIIGISYSLFFTIIGLPAMLVAEEKIVAFCQKPQFTIIYKWFLSMLENLRFSTYKNKKHLRVKNA